jgi:hypothetical protein
MSVIVYKEKLEQLMDTLIMDYYGPKDFSRAVFSYDEELKLKRFNGTVDDEINNIKCWCNRIYWANQLAYICSYSHHADCDRTIQDLDDKNKHIRHISLKTLYSDLQAIKYNLYSNSGRIFLSKEDEEKFNELCTVVADRIISSIPEA